MGSEIQMTPRRMFVALTHYLSTSVNQMHAKFVLAIFRLLNERTEPGDFDNPMQSIRWSNSWVVRKPEDLIRLLQANGLRGVPMHAFQHGEQVGVAFGSNPAALAMSVESSAPKRITESQMRDLLREQTTTQQTEMAAHVTQLCDLVHAKILENKAYIKDNHQRIYFSHADLAFIEDDMPNVFRRAMERNFDLPSIVSVKPDVGFKSSTFLAAMDLYFKTE